MIAEANKGATATGNETVGELLDRFLTHAEVVRGRSPTTLREYRRLADKVLRPELGKIKLAKLTVLDLDQLYARLTKKGFKATSVRRVHALAAASLAQGKKWRLVKENVALDATPPSVQAADVVAPDPDEVRRIIEVAEATEPPLAALLLLAVLTGARRGELCALRDGRTSTGRPALSALPGASTRRPAADGARSRRRLTRSGASGSTTSVSRFCVGTAATSTPSQMT